MALWAGAQLEAGGGCMIWNRGIMNDDTNFGEPMRRRHLPAGQPAVPPRERERRALHERGSVLSHELRRRREPARSTTAGSSGTATTGMTSPSSTPAAARACTRHPPGTAFNADVYDCEAMSKEHLDEFWLNPRLEAGTLKKADTLEALADMMEFRRRPARPRSWPRLSATTVWWPQARTPTSASRPTVCPTWRPRPSTRRASAASCW